MNRAILLADQQSTVVSGKHCPETIFHICIGSGQSFLQRPTIGSMCIDID